METIEIQTLVDITRTRVNRPNQGGQLEYDQNRNFVTLMQCIEIRSIVVYDDPPFKEIKNLKSMEFGSAYKGSHAVWTFRVVPDRVGVYNNELGSVGALIEDIDGVPIIKNLTETINIITAIFDCKDPIAKNTIIKAHKGII
jgi:hypothetical protein